MGVFVTSVRPRWSDMDAYGHINNAKTVTLLEEARIALLYAEAERHGVKDMLAGMVVAKLAVQYLKPLVFNGEDIRVELSVREMRAASFTLDYVVRGGPTAEFQVTTKAETMMVPYNVAAGYPRALTEPERDFLAGFRAGGNGA
ncbi:thioesterase [Lentzea sp. NBRC 105346]|uniref:acyl-CoA thioesterase n=1 Tax=Lentzea sp. NBRC 105346 TaxID=3032205 RepID=UPI0024A2B29E|nr:thioesterase family protein [Lentzea sp. NBRC 105346]GLZ34961.1 thioesterase [Lentzea sp. NBRC 105346]